MNRSRVLGALSLASLIIPSLIAISTLPATAEVVCQGDFQKVDGSWIQTPYCSDHHIAQFAREEGDNVTTRQVIKHPLLKEELCQGSPGLSASCGMGGDEQD